MRGSSSRFASSVASDATRAKTVRAGVGLRSAEVEVYPVDVSPDLKAFTNLLQRALLHAHLEGFYGGGDRCDWLGRQAVGQFQCVEERKIHALAGEGRHGMRGIADHC